MPPKRHQAAALYFVVTVYEDCQWESFDVEEEIEKFDSGSIFDESDIEEEEIEGEQEDTKISLGPILNEGVKETNLVFDSSATFVIKEEFSLDDFSKFEKLFNTKKDRLEFMKLIVLHAYHLKLLQIRGRIFPTLERMM